MPFSYVASTSSGADTDATSHVTNKPAGTSTGDLVLLHHCLWSANSTFPTITPPSGAVLIASYTYGDGTIMSSNYIKTDVYGIVAGAETTYTFSLSVTGWAAVGAQTWTAADTSSIATMANNSAGANAATAVPTTSVTAASGDGAAHFLNTMFYTGTPTHTAPTNFTEVLDTVAQEFSYQTSLTAGTVSAAGGTVSVAVGMIATLVLVKPGVAGTDSGPNYAGAASGLAGGSGTWTNPTNAQGAANASYAVWTAP